MTILPAELAKRLNKFIKMEPMNIRNGYADYIMINVYDLITAADTLAPVQIGRNAHQIYNPRPNTTYQIYFKRTCLEDTLKTMYYNQLYSTCYFRQAEHLFKHLPSIMIINIRDINPDFLQYLFDNNLCVHCHDVPSKYACRKY